MFRKHLITNLTYTISDLSTLRLPSTLWPPSHYLVAVMASLLSSLDTWPRVLSRHKQDNMPQVPKPERFLIGIE